MCGKNLVGDDYEKTLKSELLECVSMSNSAFNLYFRNFWENYKAGRNWTRALA